MKNTAIFGGTFNPPHLGHRAILEALHTNEKIGDILVLPSHIPPHKSGEIVDAKHRLAMCQLAFSDLPDVQVRADEIHMSGKSYTAKTLAELQKQNIDYPWFVIGADSLVSFTKWYRYADILKLAQLFVFQRDGISPQQAEQAAEVLKQAGGRVFISDFCPPHISSTYVRDALRTGQETNGCLCEAVAAYIKQNGLYKGD